MTLGKNPPTFCAIMRADVNESGAVTIADLSAIAQRCNQLVPPADSRLDQNGDATITIADISLAASAYNRSVSACT